MSIGRSVYWLFQLIGWGCFAAINILFAFLFDRMADDSLRFNAISRVSMFMMLGLLSTHIMRSVIRRLDVVQKPLDRQFAYFFFLSILFSLIPGALQTLMILYWDLSNAAESLFADKPLLLILSGSFYFFVNIVIWNLVYFICHFVSLRAGQEENRWRLEKMIREIELSNCKLQQEQK